ncbi:hypothetical protein F53441_674 [Fusarium austroafricanum]|uniref:C2H2-type domain-containing protein n=1 Tax=Fusarium austroafricanum TaxID=2364996 RepID=A0A8H4KTT5_9HYPO|nr:hypothetical protein F53441_674 [Fusarium austroafricanum]
MNLGNSESRQRLGGPRQVAGESSVQEPPPGQAPKTGRRANKRRRYEDFNTDNSGQNDDEDGGGNQHDGPKYPHPGVAILSFECPFCKLDPHRYERCRRHLFTRLSDVIQHIKRQHLLVERRIGGGAGVQPEIITLYCTRCRCLFYGVGAENRRRVHLAERIQCQIVNIEHSGVLLPREFDDLRTELRLYVRHDETYKWYIIWDVCFPGKTRPASPYVDTLLPRPQAQSMIEDELQSLHVLSPEQIRSVARRFTDRIYTSSSPASEPRRNPSVSPQARPNLAQPAPEPTYSALTYMPPNRAFSYQPLQPFLRPQGFGDDSDLSNADFGTHLGLNTSQSDHSFWNDTFSAPSQIPGFGTTPESNLVDSGYSSAPFQATSQFASQDEDDLDLYGNGVNRRGS